jgi:hypothetical protein
MIIMTTGIRFKYEQVLTIVDRWRQDIIKPALGAGYGECYLGGMSLGGLGLLLYLKQCPDDISKTIEIYRLKME